MNVIVEQLKMLNGPVTTVAAMARTHGASLLGGQVREAELALLEIHKSLDQVEEIIAVAAGKALPPIEPVPFELTKVESVCMNCSDPASVVVDGVTLCSYCALLMTAAEGRAA